MKKLKSTVHVVRLGATIVAVGLLSACTSGPDYVKPIINVPLVFKEQQGWKMAQPQDEILRGNWWKIFGDETLNQLIEKVSISNQSIHAAEAQYRQALSLTQQAQSAYYPIVTAGGSITRSLPASNVNNAVNYSATQNTAYRLNAGVSWAPDIWGSIKRSVEGSDANVQASAADLAAAKLSMQTQLAQDYFLLRTADAKANLYNRTIGAYEKSLKLAQNQFSVGVAARGDVVAAESQLKATKAQAIDVGVQRAQLEHAIAMLIGKTPAEFSITPAATAFVTAPPTIPLGIPSQLLERRPDIAATERRAAAANAKIGVAKAAYFPNLTLSATLGAQSSSFAQWLNYPAHFWSLGPMLAQTIFDGGLRKAQTAQAEATYDQTVAVYRQTVLNAFQEVEDNLATLRILEQEAALQDDAVKSSRESVTITHNQYKAGLINYLNVVTAETLALNNERAALTIQGNRLTASVLLVSALGGGWDKSWQ